MPDSYVHFEIPADDPDALMAFYGGVFGWRFQRLQSDGGEYIAISTRDEGQPGIDGGMYRRAGPDDAPRAYISVTSLDDTLAGVAAHGGSVLLGRTAAPGVGWIAIVADPEGNAQGVIQPEAGAA